MAEPATSPVTTATLALEVVRARNQYYQYSYKQALLALLISLLTSALLVGYIMYQRGKSPIPTYFATNQDGSLKTYIPLYIPYVDDNTVLAMVKETVAGTFAYDFLNYRSSLQNMRSHFTPDGYQNFIDALEKSENLRTVLEKKFAVAPIFEGEPQILQQQILPATNTYAWRVQVPITLNYVSSQEQKRQPVLVTAVVTRVSSLISESSIAIASLILEDRITIPNK